MKRTSWDFPLGSDKWWERRMKELDEEVTIRCPYCESVYAEPGDERTYDFTSYHGENGPQEVECDECGKEFLIEEIVSREFQCTKKEEKND